ncbi:MAG: hypothetical protein AB1390_09870, partial [Nitrospirota bacterium]
NYQEKTRDCVSLGTILRASKEDISVLSLSEREHLQKCLHCQKKLDKWKTLSVIPDSELPDATSDQEELLANGSTVNAPHYGDIADAILDCLRRKFSLLTPTLCSSPQEKKEYEKGSPYAAEDREFVFREKKIKICCAISFSWRTKTNYQTAIFFGRVHLQSPDHKIEEAEKTKIYKSLSVKLICEKKFSFDLQCNSDGMFLIKEEDWPKIKNALDQRNLQWEVNSISEV